jgi:hypothetical protein
MPHASPLQARSPGLLQGVARAATRPRRPMPRPGASHGWAGPHARRAPSTLRGGGRGGWGHQGTGRATPGGTPAGAARAAAGNAVPPAAQPPGPQPPGPDAAARPLDMRGQGGPRRRPRGARSSLRAGRARVRVWLPTRAQGPRRRWDPAAAGGEGRGAVEPRGSHGGLLRQLGAPRVQEEARGSGRCWGTCATHGHRLARGGTRRRGGGGARGGARPGGGALSVVGSHLWARWARPLVGKRGAATAAGERHPEPLLG